MEQYKPIIGLEIHVELGTASKMFCQCSANWFGAPPNTHVCPVCLGMPGALPVPNKKAVEWTIMISKALGCTINKHSKFDRKHYFYPDLPKGYQISQYDEPIGVNGKVKVKVKNTKGEFEDKEFRIRRVHLEEDTGKLSHVGDDTLIDFNRSSVPLVEIVTEPDFNNSDDVKAFLEELQVIIRYLGVSEADMEKGSMRLEPNISVKLKTQEGFPPYKVEVKNINSFNFVKQAIEFELKRHVEMLESGETPKQETRGYNENKKITYSQRVKEEAADYRYFPEPDIPAMDFSDEYLDGLFKQIPELPVERMARYISEFKLKPMDAFILSRDKKMAEYFEEVNAKFKNQKSTLQFTIENAEQALANAIINKKINTDVSSDEFIAKFIELSKPKETDTALLASTIDKIIAANPKAVEDYKAGKQNSIMFLLGQVMREMKGQADAGVVRTELEKKLQ